MADRHVLPAGMTPRLLSRDNAAAYLGIVAETFEEHVRPHVKPVEIGSRRLWDVRALDRWLDRRSGAREPDEDDLIRSAGEWGKSK